MAKSKISKLSILTEFDVYNSAKDLDKKDAELLLAAQKWSKQLMRHIPNFMLAQPFY